MEADWEFEIGGGAPLIEADWNGFVDLRSQPGRVSDLVECEELPGLAESLLRLNGTDSQVWTSKTDVFTPENIDRDEMDASIEESAHAVACYIDVIMRSSYKWPDQLAAEKACRKICKDLRAIELRCCRIDIVIRKAMKADEETLAATVYFAACGSTCAKAKLRLGECLSAFAETMAPEDETPR